MRSWRWYSKLLFALAVVAVCYFVWPTPWRTSPTIHAHSGIPVLVRQNRLTGRFQYRIVALGGGGWVDEKRQGASTQVVDPDLVEAMRQRRLAADKSAAASESTALLKDALNENNPELITQAAVRLVRGGYTPEGAVKEITAQLVSFRDGGIAYLDYVGLLSSSLQAEGKGMQEQAKADAALAADAALIARGEEMPDIVDRDVAVAARGETPGYRGDWAFEALGREIGREKRAGMIAPDFEPFRRQKPAPKVHSAFDDLNAPPAAKGETLGRKR
jgi:hypothetical protein